MFLSAFHHSEFSHQTHLLFLLQPSNKKVQPAAKRHNYEIQVCCVSVPHLSL